MSIENITQLFRYEKVNLNEEFTPELQIRTYQITKQTDKSFIIALSSGGKPKSVSKTGKKRFAYPTKLEAWENCLHRTIRAIQIQDTLLQRQKGYLKLINKSKPQ